MTAEEHPDNLLKKLKAKFGSKRAQANLDIVHEVCREIAGKRGDKNFSPTAIGRNTAERNGPRPNTLLSPGGKHFRDLIDSWSAFSGGTVSRKNNARQSPKDDVLERIEDPRLRSIVGPILRENRTLRAENNLLKAKSNVSIDMRPRIEVRSSISTEVIEPETSKLLDAEIDALRTLLTPKTLARSGFAIGRDGEVIAEREFRIGQDLLPCGFISGLKKLLNDRKISAVIS